MQVLLRTNLVVPKPEISEGVRQLIKAAHGYPIELLLQRPKEAFNPAVLPRRTDLCSLMTNTYHRKNTAKHFTGEDRRVVRSYRPWLAELAYRQKQITQ